MPNTKTVPAIDIKDPRFFYTDSYVDYLIADCIGEFYNKSWLRSIEAQKGKVNSRIKMVSIGIDDEVNRRYGYPVLNGRKFEMTDVLVGKYDGNLFPYYNKKEFLDKYGYDTEISLRSILTDTKIFSMRLAVVTFDGYSEFENIFFIAQRDGSSLIVVKDPKCVTKYFWKKKMVDKDPTTIFQLSDLVHAPLFGPKGTGATYKPNDTDFIEYLNSNFFLRIFTEPHGSVYYYNGLAQSLITKVQYQGRPCVGIPINKLQTLLHIDKPNDTNAYSLYIGYETDGVLAYSLNGAILSTSNGYMIFPGNQYVDDLIPEMATSTLTMKISLYIFDEYQKTGTESGECWFADHKKPIQGTIPYRKNISHPDNIRCYRKNIADFYHAMPAGWSPLTHQNYGAITNTPKLYWQYNGKVTTPGSSIADMSEEVILSYMKKYDALRPTEEKNRTDKGIFVSDQYRDEVFTSIPGKTDNSWLGHIQYPNIFNPSKWNTSLGVYNVFGRKSQWNYFPMTIDYYEADPAITDTEWLNPYEKVINYSSAFTSTFLKVEAAKVDKAAKAAGIADWRGNLLWKWNYDFDDYVDSIHYGNLRAYQLSKFAELSHNNQAILHTYMNRVNNKKWQVRSYTINYDEIKERRNPVTTTEFIHPNPEDRYHFDKPQYWVESTTTDTFGRFIEIFVNGIKIKTNLSCAVNYMNYIFFDADKVPDHAEVIVDLSKNPMNEFENKKTGSFMLTSTTGSIPFPDGFGNVRLDTLVFYNKQTGEILDPNEIGLHLTERKDQFEIENMVGDIENIVTTPGLADISFLRTKTKDFYKTVDMERIILSTSRVDIPIPISPEPPFFPSTEVNLDNVMISTDSINGLNVDIGVTTTDNHFVHYETLNVVAPYKGTFEIPNYQEYGIPDNIAGAESRISERFRCYMFGELMPQSYWNVSGPYHPTEISADGTYMGGKLKVEWQLPTGFTYPSSTADVIIEYIPYRINERQSTFYPYNTHPSGPCGSLGEGFRFVETTPLTPGTIVFAGGNRISSNRMHMIKENQTDLFYFDHVPSGANLDITLTGSGDLLNLIGDFQIDLTAQKPEYAPEVPPMDKIPDWPFMMGHLNQYTYQEGQMHKEGSVNVYDMTDYSQWGISINSKHISTIQRRQIIHVDTPFPEDLFPHPDGIYNHRMLIVDDKNSSNMGYYNNKSLYGLDPSYPLDSRLLPNDYGTTTALPLNIKAIGKIDRTKTRKINCFETLIIYKKGHPMKIVLPTKFYVDPVNAASLTLTALSDNDIDLYDTYGRVYSEDNVATRPFNQYASILPVSDLVANNMILTDDIVFKYIRAFSKWQQKEITPIVVLLRGTDGYDAPPLPLSVN